MNQKLEFSMKLSDIVDKNEFDLDVPMSEHTYFKVGGPADIMVTPSTKDKVIEVINLCKAENIPYIIIGNGSNLLVRDGGIRGVVIKLSALNNIIVNEEDIIADSGALLSDVSKKALEFSLTGFEFACGIPGSVGGAVFMNAGAYDGELCNVISEALVIDENGNLKVLNNSELELGYRTSAVMTNGYVVIQAKFKLKKGAYEKIKGRIDELTARREDKQPLEYPSAGSTFKRPVGYFAGKLIQDAGLKGFCIGGASVSEKHSGFIINKDHATANDILNLIMHVQRTVKDMFGVDLSPEVRIIGEDILEPNVLAANQ
ncbi:UDP-N-acetylmuramate dehydrogenase [Clostridium amylolyticum]|uniref:UDP-N-acetylenolpyruvoylglucosamine reductase n=1 Tax=Clostridium amylolyticum TaxID=1121298 RepID=A0A1M6H1K4_9CLOT|nr:UDP-N-acetylmuramate dehydrogenase [Clostridium amylolyticum]SHJ16059.1 UDP-N-acetylmuramate dehydrogenase [Clostridium amylolyticum]